MCLVSAHEFMYLAFHNSIREQTALNGAPVLVRNRGLPSLPSHGRCRAAINFSVLGSRHEPCTCNTLGTSLCFAIMSCSMVFRHFLHLLVARGRKCCGFIGPSAWAALNLAEFQPFSEEVNQTFHVGIAASSFLRICKSKLVSFRMVRQWRH